MGHCPQSYRHGGHCLGRCIRYNLLHALMRTITLIIIHCSATPQGVRLSFDDCQRDHIRHRGFNDIGSESFVSSFTARTETGISTGIDSRSSRPQPDEKLSLF